MTDMSEFLIPSSEEIPILIKDGQGQPAGSEPDPGSRTRDGSGGGSGDGSGDGTGKAALSPQTDIGFSCIPPGLLRLATVREDGGAGILDAAACSELQSIFTGLTSDGILNFFDISAFLTAFGAGCP